MQVHKSLFLQKAELHVYLFPEKIIKLSHILLIDFDKCIHDQGLTYIIKLFPKNLLSGFQKSHTFPF